jgi:hypothetical protein
MKKIAAVMIVLSLLSTPMVFAKRAAPAQVAAVRIGEMELRAPTSQLGCIEAWDTKHNELLWRRQIYVVRYTAGLERDVQDVFIRSMEMKDNVLIVTNENQSEYVLNLETLEVRVNKGALIEGKK